MQSSKAGASDPRFGVMTHFAQGWTPDWAWIASIRSISSVRDELYWNVVEPQKGSYVFPDAYDSYMSTLKQAGISPLIVLGFENSNYDGGMTPYTDEAMAAYGRYGVQVLSHYGSQIKAVEIWNEYNGTFCQGPATTDRAGTYAKMLKQAYTQIKAARPDVIVVGGATIETPLPYWENLMQNGALASMDVLSVHPYRYNSAPEGIENDISTLQALVKKYNNGQSKPIWVTEVGWGIQQNPGEGEMFIDQAVQAKFLVRAYALLLSAGVERVYWYLLRDYDDFTLGLTTATATPKLSAYAMQTLINELAGAKCISREVTDPNIYSILFVRPDGTEVRVLWALKPATVNLSGYACMISMVGKQLGAPATFALTDQPVFVEGSLRGLPAPAADTETALTDSDHGFTGTQGQNGWSFGSFIGSGTNFQPMITYTVTDWTEIWSNQYAYNDVTPGDQHPSLTSGWPVSAVRRWTSTVEGTVHITGSFQCGEGGDGVGVRILVNGLPLFRKLLGHGQAISYGFDFLQPVHIGTTLDFAVDPGSGTDITDDATTMTATILSHPGATTQQNLSPTAWSFDGVLAGP
ncbi:MAG TPA: glycosyl hydrolase [Opitutaceae bacterium]|nr:glycosyl hydrolase [Opitutaceae bacterium]